MTDTFVRIRIMLVLILSVCAGVVWVLPSLGEAQTGQYLQVSFLDVGQGDSIFIQTASGVQVLIDGGPNSGVLRALSQQMKFSDRTIDIVVGTHPDMDHIGGLVDVLDRYEVAVIVTTENKGESNVANIYRTLVEQEGAEIIYARRGQQIQLDASTTLEVLFPELDATNMESNASSIILRLVYGEVSFMLTGDSPKRIEEYLVLTEGEHLQSTVLKAGHHGSRTSTSELFLDEVNPAYAVISAEKNSRYGHPHVEVTDALFNAGVETFSTAEVGSITFLSDGEDVWVE